MALDILLSVWIGILLGSVTNSVLGWVDARRLGDEQALRTATAFRMQLAGAVTLGAVTASLMVML